MHSTPCFQIKHHWLYLKGRFAIIFNSLFGPMRIYMVGKLSKRLIPTYKWLKIARFLWSLFYLQVYLWITASSLTQFMATYGNHKNVTCFIPLLEKNDGGVRSVRFSKGGSMHRGYTINVKYLPAQLVRRLFTLVCISKKHWKNIKLFLMFSLCERRSSHCWRDSLTSWTLRRRWCAQDRVQCLLSAMDMEKKCLALRPLKKMLTWTQPRLNKVMGFENHIKLPEYPIPAAPAPHHKNCHHTLHPTLH